MPSIDNRPDGRYRARWREYLGGPQRTRQFKRKGDAVRFLDGIRGDLAYGLYVDPAGARTLFRDYAESWRVSQVHRPEPLAPREARRGRQTTGGEAKAGGQQHPLEAGPEVGSTAMAHTAPGGPSACGT